MAVDYLQGLGSTSASAASATSTKNILGKEEFLKMLIAQLKNQDPLNPLSSTDFTAQLAQFSSLEQLQNVNDTLTAMTRQQASISAGQSVSLIGKEVTANGNAIQADGGTVELSYGLAADAEKTWVKVYNDQGSLVETLTFTGQRSGSNTVAWNAGGHAGGSYTFEVQALDAGGNSVDAQTVMKGVVSGVNYREGTPYLVVGGREIGLGDVLTVRSATD